MKGDQAGPPQWGLERISCPVRLAPGRRASSGWRGALWHLYCPAAVWGPLCPFQMLWVSPRVPGHESLGIVQRDQVCDVVLVSGLGQNLGSKETHQ